MVKRGDGANLVTQITKLNLFAAVGSKHPVVLYSQRLGIIQPRGLAITAPAQGPCPLCNHCVRTIIVLAPLAHGKPGGSQKSRLPSPVVPASRYEQLLVAANFDARRSRMLGAKSFNHLAQSLRAMRKLLLSCFISHLYWWYACIVSNRQQKIQFTLATTRNALAVFYCTDLAPPRRHPISAPTSN